MKRIINHPVVGLVLAVLFLVPLSPAHFPAFAIEPPSTDDPGNGLPKTDWCPYIGIGDPFGIWPDGVVPIAYNHTNAPEGYDAAEVERRLVRPAFSIIEGIADVHFDYRGVTDAAMGNDHDSVVVMGWDGSLATRPNITGYASPRFSDYDPRYGYWPSVDGVLALNPGSPQFEPENVDTGGLRTMIHELLHVLGLGHPEHPISIMNGGFFRFSFPQADDIAGLQAMYGPPDEYISPPYGIELRQEPLPGGIRVESAEIVAWDSIAGEYTHQPGSPTRISGLAGGHVAGVFHIANLEPDTVITPWSIDPLGNAQRWRATFTGQASNRTRVETSGPLVFQTGYLPGLWSMRLAIGQTLLTEIQFEVTGPPTPFNQPPAARLDVQTDGRGAFTLDLLVDDPESHPIRTDWHLPGAQEPVLNTRGIDYESESDGPVRVFVQIFDDDPDRHRVVCCGFNTLASRYLVTPAEEGVPTYFADDRLLHVPVIASNGETWSLDLRLTALPGITFKLLAANTATMSGDPGTAAFDPASNSIHLPKVIVVDGGAQTEYFDLRFEVDFNAAPIRMTLR